MVYLGHHCMQFALICTGGQDFTTVSNGVVSFQPSSSSEPQCSEIPIEDDNTLESNENFQVILDTADRAVEINSSTADVNILDNDSKIIIFYASYHHLLLFHVYRSDHWIQ